MRRREFLKKSATATLATTALFSMGKWSIASSNPSNGIDMVAIKNGMPGPMFDSAIKEMGGMSAFVKKGQSVVVKPNIVWDAPPERAANTNPELVGRIVEHCLKAGANKVYVLDHTSGEWTRCYKVSGIEDAVKKAGGVMVPANNESQYVEVDVPKGKSLKKTKVHKLVLDSDVFINVPVLKNHGGTKLTLSIKNLMGIVWDREYYHDNDLHQCIADFSTIIKPDLNIMDGYRVMKRNGPIGKSKNDVVTMKYQLISRDMVAIDSASAKIFGVNPDDVHYITKAQKLGVGTTNLDSLNIKRMVV